VLLQEKQDEPVKRPGRGSILAYFKPVPPSSDKAQSDVASSDPVEVPSTPPTSPPPPSHPRKRRRLTTRPQLSEPNHHSEEEGGGNIRLDDDLIKESIVHRRDRPSGDETTALFNSSVHRAQRPALSEVAVNTVDPQDGAAGALTDGKTKTKKRPAKRPARDMTQTTLSLSIHKEPGFTICGVCDILYNPLNEKDRRDHNRRHAAYSRNKRKAAE
jgi:hypothetical protein